MAATNQVDLPSTGFVRLRRVLEVFPISKSQWHRGVREGRYPAPVRLGVRTSAYDVAAIRKLIEDHRKVARS